MLGSKLYVDVAIANPGGGRRRHAIIAATPTSVGHLGVSDYTYMDLHSVGARNSSGSRAARCRTVASVQDVMLVVGSASWGIELAAGSVGHF